MNIQPGFAATGLEQASNPLYTDIHDQQKHLSVIHAIAEELARPVEEIAERYEQVLSQLKDTARVPDYLPLFVAKRIKQVYRQH